MTHECPNCGADLSGSKAPIKQNHPRTGNTYKTCPECNAEWRLIDAPGSGPLASFVITGRIDEQA